jgi:hypothetical protein
MRLRFGSIMPLCNTLLGKGDGYNKLENVLRRDLGLDSNLKFAYTPISIWIIILNTKLAKYLEFLENGWKSEKSWG